ncbi:transcriptional regulator, partial [Streptomyces spectabilis]
RTLSAAGRRQALAHARTCYDHLAGTIGVAITDTMIERRLLDLAHGLSLTHAGADWLEDLGIAVPTGTRRPSVRSCLDWTERRPHLAGAVGAALCRHAFDTGWISRVGTTRAVVVTPLGEQALHHHLGLPGDLLAGR